LENENKGSKLKVEEYSVKLEEEQKNNETLARLAQEILERHKEEFMQYKKKLNEVNTELVNANKELMNLRSKEEECNKLKQINRELTKVSNRLEYYKALAKTQEEKYKNLKNINSQLHAQLAKSEVSRLKSRKDVLHLIGYKNKSIEELAIKLEELQQEPRTTSNFSQYKAVRADRAINTNRKSQQITSVAILPKVNVIASIDSFIRSSRFNET
jgi:DNA repair exonuclease SbcCD ATPase subunit